MEDSRARSVLNISRHVAQQRIGLRYPPPRAASVLTTDICSTRTRTSPRNVDIILSTSRDSARRLARRQQSASSYPLRYALIFNEVIHQKDCTTTSCSHVCGLHFLHEHSALDKDKGCKAFLHYPHHAQHNRFCSLAKYGISIRNLHAAAKTHSFVVQNNSEIIHNTRRELKPSPFSVTLRARNANFQLEHATNTARKLSRKFWLHANRPGQDEKVSLVTSADSDFLVYVGGIQ